MAGTKDILYDPEDEGIFLSRKWHISDSGYAIWRGLVDGKKQTIRLHRLINNTPEGMITDHINHNRLDNRRANLRTVDFKENAQGIPGRPRHKYFGLPKNITFDKTRGKYMVKKPVQKRFNTLEEAVAFIGVGL